MLNFQFYQKTRVLVGANAVSRLGEQVEHIGGTKALIVGDPGIVSAGIMEKVTAALDEAGKPYVTFTENEPNPPIAACEKGYEICAAEGCDVIIGLGGGSNRSTSPAAKERPGR